MKKFLALYAYHLQVICLPRPLTINQIFAGKNACFILYDAQNHKMVEEYNPKRCK